MYRHTPHSSFTAGGIPGPSLPVAEETVDAGPEVPDFSAQEVDAEVRALMEEEIAMACKDTAKQCREEVSAI